MSDGWYGVAARLDRALSDQLRRGRLFVGQKILVQGAELRGVAEPTPPLSAAAEEAFLALRANGVRPARWDAKLGARRRAEAFPLRTLRPDGGPVARTLVHVERVYPTCWQETGRADGRVVTRGDAAEARAAREWEANRAALLERVAHDVRAETEAARAAAGRALVRRLRRRRRFRRRGGTSREGRAGRRGTPRTSGSTRDETARVRPATRRSRRTRGRTHGRGAFDGVRRARGPRERSRRGVEARTRRRDVRRSRWMPRTHRWA